MRVFCYILLSILLIALVYESCTFIRIRKETEEVCLRAFITTDGTQHYQHKKRLYVRSESDGTSAVYNRGYRLLLDSIRDWKVRAIGINERDTFELLEYVNLAEDTLLYDAYSGESIWPEQFEPHYKEAMYWEFNYSNL